LSEIAVLPALKAAFALWRASPRIAGGPLALGFVGAVLAAASAFTGSVWGAPVGRLVLMAGLLMATGALFRTALADDHPTDPAFRPGPGGFQWRAVEWRLLGAGLLISCVLAVTAAGSALLALLLNAALMAAGVSEVAAVQTAALVGLVGVMFASLSFVGVRTSVVLPATVDAGRIVAPWGMTKGRFWPVLAAWLALAVPVLAVATLVGVGLFIAVGGRTADPVRVEAAAELLRGLVWTLASPLSVGLSAHIYRRLRPPA
jgi:hypothetical protein